MPSEHLPSHGTGGESHDPITADMFNDIADSNVPAFAIRQLPGLQTRLSRCSCSG